MWKLRYYIQKCMTFWRESLLFLHSTDLWCSLYLAFEWPVAVCYCNCERKIGMLVDDDWQVVVSSSSSQWIHSAINWLSLVPTTEIIISIGVWKYQPSTLSQNILVSFDFSLFWRVMLEIIVAYVQLPAIFSFGWYSQILLEGL